MAPRSASAVRRRPACPFTAEGVAWDDSSQNRYRRPATRSRAKPSRQLQEALSIQLPAVKTFAVNNLLFPGNNIKFSSAHVPGDLVTFGDLATSAITVAPLYATLSPGQTCRFSASGAGGSAVHWNLRTSEAGSVKADGTYRRRIPSPAPRMTW